MSMKEKFNVGDIVYYSEAGYGVVLHKINKPKNGLLENGITIHWFNTGVQYHYCYSNDKLFFRLLKVKS